MGDWQTIQPVDFTEDGDATSAAIRKHDADITNIYELLHRVRRFDFGTDPPADPIEGHLWLVEGQDGNPHYLKVYKNGKWQRISCVATISPSSPPPAEGCLRIIQNNGFNYLLVFYNGDWRYITPITENTPGHLIKTTDGEGSISTALFDSLYPTSNPTSDIDLEVGKAIRLYGTAQTVNLHINANNGLYRMTYAIFGNTVNDKYHMLKLNNTTYANSCLLLSSENSENQSEKDFYYDNLDALRIGFGALGVFTGIINTKQPNVCSVFRGHADQTVDGMNILIVGSHYTGSTTISKLGTIDFRGTCTYRITVERLL